MLGQLGALDEYTNQGALIGLDATGAASSETAAEVNNALKKMDPISRQRAINKLTTPPMQSRGSRAEMEKYFSELPEHVREQLKKGDLRLADYTIYSIKPVTSRTIKMFETQDEKQVGLTNVSNARLPKNQVLLVSGIILLAGVAAGTTDDDIISTSYGFIENFPTIANGEFDLKGNKKQLVPDWTSNNVFKTQNFNQVTAGYYKLANPRLLLDDVLIELTIELGTIAGIAPNTHIWAGLHGTITTP